MSEAGKTPEQDTKVILEIPHAVFTSKNILTNLADRIKGMDQQTAEDMAFMYNALSASEASLNPERVALQDETQNRLRLRGISVLPVQKVYFDGIDNPIVIKGAHRAEIIPSRHPIHGNPFKEKVDFVRITINQPNGL